MKMPDWWKESYTEDILFLIGVLCVSMGFGMIWGIPGCLIAAGLLMAGGALIHFSVRTDGKEEE